MSCLFALFEFFTLPQRKSCFSTSLQILNLKNPQVNIIMRTNGGTSVSKEVEMGYIYKKVLTEKAFQLHFCKIVFRQ